MSDHVAYLGADDELRYLARCYDDGTMTIATRPVGGYRWSPETILHEQPVTTLEPVAADGGGER